MPIFRVDHAQLIIYAARVRKQTLGGTRTRSQNVFIGVVTRNNGNIREVYHQRRTGVVE